MAKVQVSKIVIDEAIYPRSSVSEFNVNRLVSALETGAPLPPITVEAKTYRLVDGRHRYEAYKKEGIKTIEVIEKVYASEADLFADAVRCNIGHGEPLDQYTVRNAIIRLTAYGYQREQISDVVRLPIEQIEKIERGFAVSQDGKPVALKGGLNHLKGRTLDPQQMEVNRHYSGGKAIFYVRQICDLLENDIAPVSVGFVAEMDRLVDLWRQKTGRPSSRSSQPQSQPVAPT
jgi:ParB/Sulfiredoxin domain